MSLQDFPFKPGIFSDNTDRGTGQLGFWKDGDHIRFFHGLPEKIGGWIKDNPAIALSGKVRSAIDWITLAQIKTIAFGTHKKLEIWQGALFYDITPVGSSGTLGNNPIATTDTSTTVTITHVAHGREIGDAVIFSGATAVGGITISGEYEVVTTPSADTYTITHSSAATSTATGGGASVAYTYLLAIGEEDSVVDTGWGIGPWGGSTWGTARASGNVVKARMWSLDTWGEDLIACPNGGSIYRWDAGTGVGTRAAVIAAAPTNNKFIFVSQEDRHLVACGAGGDPLMIQWCDQEDYDVWTATTTNTAGDKRLDQGNELVTVIKVRSEHLIFTDEAIYSMVFVGPPFTFGFRPLGSNYRIMGQGAGTEFEGRAFWMGQRGFYIYDGTIRNLPCTVSNHVFDDFNYDQRAKVVTGVNARFNEIWWMYPSENSTENDRYVIYNTQENAWYYGTIVRTIFIGDSDIFEDAYGVDGSGYLFWHERGVNDDANALPSSIESGDVELSVEGQGGMMLHLSKVTPDFDDLTGSIDMTITTKKYQQASETQTSGPHTITSSTEFVNPRVRGRQVSFAFETTDVGDDWRLGIIRADVRPHGRR